MLYVQTFHRKIINALRDVFAFYFANSSTVLFFLKVDSIRRRVKVSCWLLPLLAG